MLCIVAMFTPTLFMSGVARAMFLPLALAVGFAMIASYFLSSTLVPILSIWLLRGRDQSRTKTAIAENRFHRFQQKYGMLLRKLQTARGWLIPGYFAAAVLITLLAGRSLGTEIFPQSNSGQMQLRLRAAAGTDIDGTETVAQRTLDIIKRTVGPENVQISLGLLGVHGANFPINFVHLWNGGPEEGLLQVHFKPGTPWRMEALKERLRREFAAEVPNVSFSFEPADIVSQVMSMGANTPIDVAVSGPDLAQSRAFAERVKSTLEKLPMLRDVQFGQSLDYPTVDVTVDRERAGIIGADMAQVSRALIPATWSSRFVALNFWADPNSGVAYQVQVQIPQRLTTSLEDIGNLPIIREGVNDPALHKIGKAKEKVKGVSLRNIAEIREGTAMGQYQRYNMERLITVRANIAGSDIGGAARQVKRAIHGLGSPPAGVNIAIRGQVVPMEEMLDGLRRGLAVAVIVIFLLLVGNFQSIKLSLIVASTVPAVFAGVELALWLTGTTLNLQSFMGAIMAVGVAVANAILLVTFAERSRLDGAAAIDAAIEGARSRLRPILMTSAAMIAGMMPMALGLGDSGAQASPLGRAVVGGLLAATIATLLILPAIFALVQDHSPRHSVSLSPLDRQSSYYQSALKKT
jgi:multidrug efflux pump subunit AcrB